MPERIVCTHYPIIFKLGGKTWLSPVKDEGWRELPNDATLADFEIVVDGMPSPVKPEPRRELVGNARYDSRSGGGEYVVNEYSDGDIVCNCPGFQYRKKCRHVEHYRLNYA